MHRVHTESLTKDEKRQIWNDIVEDYLSSGMSCRRYSQKHEIKTDHLSYYVYSFRQKHQKQEPSVSSKFIPLHLSDSTNQQTIVIQRADLKIELPLTISKELLETVFMTMAKTC